MEGDHESFTLQFLWIQGSVVLEFYRGGSILQPRQNFPMPTVYPVPHGLQQLVPNPPFKF